MEMSEEGVSIKEAFFSAPVLKEKDFSFRYKAALHLAAVGGNAKEISEALDIPVSSIRSLLASQSARDEIDRIRYSIFQKEPERIFRNILPKAVNTAFEIMQNPETREGVRMDAAFRFMDRALGKPVQEIKQETSGLKEVFDRLDAIEKNRKLNPEAPIVEAEIVTEEGKPAETQDELDAWMEKNL